MKPLRLLALLALTLNACTGSEGQCPSLPGGARYCLQAAPALRFSVLQQARLRFGEQQMTLLTRVENDAAGMRFVGLTPLGQTLMSVSWENGALRADLPPALQGKLDPALLLALIQIAQWPAEQVRAGLAPHWELRETPEGRRLHLTEHNDIMLDIAWEGRPTPSAIAKRITIQAPAAGFRLDVLRLEEEE